MDKFQRGILDLVKASLTKQKIILPDSFDWDKAIELATKHQIVPMLYYGAVNSKLILPEEILKKLEIYTFKSVVVNENQLHTISLIFQKFQENNIDFLPLKGTILKYLYPKPEMRSMGDADILIKTEQYEKVVPIIENLGFSFIEENTHEYTWHKSSLHLELHKRLIPSYTKDYDAYYGDGWRLAHKTETCKYEMTDEDNFIYNFTHYAKHYRDAGIGIRHLTDLFVLLNSYSDINFAYIKRELKKLQLWEFYKNSKNTIDVWYKGALSNEKTDFITQRIFDSGSYGKHEVAVIADAVKVSKSKPRFTVKFVSFLRLAFLPYKNMKKIYPCLGKYPFLLPFMWIIRGITSILFKRQNIDIQNNDLKLMTVENIKSYQDELNFVGLDFNFKE